MGGARSSERGFTLIELMVVLGVIGVLAAAAIPAAESLTGANARQAAGQLAGSMRALFDTAAMRHATCRLALDLEARAYWAECAPGQAGVARDPEHEQQQDEERFPEERDADMRRLLSKTKFGAFRDRLVGKRELPGKAAFGEVHVEGRREAVTKGTAYVYFFAGGQAQRAYVPVVDGSYLYTIVLEPFTGRARVVTGPVEVKE